MAGEAGFAPAALYGYFASKDELFLALMDAEVSARVTRVLADPPPNEQAAVAIGDRPWTIWIYSGTEKLSAASSATTQNNA